MSARSGTPPSHCCPSQRHERTVVRADTTQLHSSVRDEVTQWFFDDYLPTWIGVGAGTIARGPEFILDYWSAPLHWSDDQGGRWIPDAPPWWPSCSRCRPDCAPQATPTPRCPTRR